ncbi:MAG: hypothetical protein J5I98_19750 [Phaeodactylibacter sp.]|nr:hypothetical protein [Phaeodactylibacter sp.]
MKPIELAQKYLEIFYSGKNPGQLYGILADDLRFQGPFYHFSSARGYVERLKADPPVGCAFELLYVFHDDEKANLICRFRKGDVTTLMSQLFECGHGRIKRILLIFDGNAFRENS